MACNVGTVDRVIRWIIGLALIAWAFWGLSGTGRWIAAVPGLVLLITGTVRFCPLWALFGINTCAAKHGPAVR